MTPKELATNWFTYLDACQYDKLRALMADNHQFYNPMTPDALGQDEHIGMMQQMMDSFEGGHIIDLVFEENNRVAVRGRWAGKHTGEFNGVPATGNELEFSWTDIFEVENGKVSREYFEMNPMSIMAQIGAVPA